MAQAHKKRGGSRKANRGASKKKRETDQLLGHRGSEANYRRLANGKVITLTHARNTGKASK